MPAASRCASVVSGLAEAVVARALVRAIIGRRAGLTAGLPVLGLEVEVAAAREFGPPREVAAVRTDLVCALHLHRALRHLGRCDDVIDQLLVDLRNVEQ